MSTALSMAIASWVNAYVQIHPTVYIKKRKETGLQSSALLNNWHIFLIKWLYLDECFRFSD